MVSNIGTAEHVTDQEAVFRNIHNLSHFRIVHWAPLAGAQIRHGFWGYEIDFFLMLAKLNNYIIEKLYNDISDSNGYKVIVCSYRKKNTNKFIWDSNLPLYENKL